MNRPIRTNDSEFCLFLDTCRSLGIDVQTVHHLPKDDEHKWQDVFVEQGYEITTLAAWAFVVGSVWFIFSTGVPQCVEDASSEEGWREVGERGSFMFAYDTAKKQAIPRAHIHFGDGHKLSKKTNWDAMQVMQSMQPSGRPDYSRQNAEMIARFNGGGYGR